MSQQSHDSSLVRQVDLPKMPPEILFKILKYVVETHNQQVLPSPYMRVSKSVGQHVAGLLTQNCTLQVECRHPTSYHLWATSMYRSSGKGEYLRSPGLPTIKGSVVRWSKFRSLFLSAETIGKVDSVYIKLVWMRDLAFTILFHHNQPPTIKTHAAYQDITLPAPLHPDLVHWTQQPAKCSVKWIDAFISDMRDQSYTDLAQHHIDLDRDLYAKAMKEMKVRQLYNHAGRLRRNTKTSVPKMLGINEAFILKDTFRDLLKNRQVAREVLRIELEDRFGKFEVRERRE